MFLQKSSASIHHTCWFMILRNSNFSCDSIDFLYSSDLLFKFTLLYMKNTFQELFKTASKEAQTSHNIKVLEKSNRKIILVSIFWVPYMVMDGGWGKNDLIFKKLKMGGEHKTDQEQSRKI